MEDAGSLGGGSEWGDDDDDKDSLPDDADGIEGSLHLIGFYRVFCN